MFGTRLKDWDIFIMSSFNVFAWSWERCGFLLWLNFATWKIEIRFLVFFFLLSLFYGLHGTFQEIPRPEAYLWVIREEVCMYMYINS